jgi:hypothetical protein
VAASSERLARDEVAGMDQLGSFVSHPATRDHRRTCMWKTTEKFNAIGTSGEEYVIVEMTNQAEHASEIDRVSEAIGARKYRLEDGRDLSAEKDGTFIVVETDEVLKAVSPSAPTGA